MFHPSQVEFQNDTHGVCPSADRDPRMREIEPFKNSANVAPGENLGVFILGQYRYDRQEAAVAYGFYTVTFKFGTDLESLLSMKQFEVGCEAGGGEVPVDYSSETRTDENGNAVYVVEMHSDNATPAGLEAKGAKRIIARRELYPNSSDETRLRRVTAHLLSQAGLGHTERFPTDSRYYYDGYIADLKARGIEYVTFTDGFSPCVMTAETESHAAPSSLQEVDTYPASTTETPTIPIKKAA
jgi:hypothetical protein